MHKYSSFYALSYLVLALLFTSCSSSEKQTVEQKNANLYYSHGTQMLVNQNYTKALEMLQKANKLSPNNSKTLNNLGMAYYFKNKLINAKKYLNLALKADPKNSDARNNLASIYFQTGDLKNAEKEYQYIASKLVYEHLYRVYYNLALINLRRGNYPQAESYLSKSITENANYCPSNYRLGLINKSKRNYTQALSWFKKAKSGTCVKFAAPLYEEAMVYIDLHDHKKARTILHEIISRYSDTEYSQMAKSKLREIDSI